MPKRHLPIGIGIIVLFSFYFISFTLATTSPTRFPMLSTSPNAKMQKIQDRLQHSLFQHYRRPRRKIAKSAFITNGMDGNPVLVMKKKVNSNLQSSGPQFRNPFNVPLQQILRPIAVDVQQPNLPLYYVPLIVSQQNNKLDESGAEEEFFTNDNYEVIPLSIIKDSESKARSAGATSKLHDDEINFVYPSHNNSSKINFSSTTSYVSRSTAASTTTTSSSVVISPKTNFSTTNSNDKNLSTTLSSYKSTESTKRDNSGPCNKSEISLSQVENNFTRVLHNIMSLLSSVEHVLSELDDNNVAASNQSLITEIPTTKIQKHDISSLGRCDPAAATSSERDSVRSENVIGKILESIEAIKSEPNMSGKEELPCDISGFWSSLAGGMLLNVTAYGNMLQISLAQKTPRSTKGFLLDPQWNLKGLIPFYPKEALVIVTGANEKDKHVATFIGECRVCNGGEMVTGNWLLGRISRDCKDQRASQELLSDIWRRERLTVLRSERLRSIQERRAIRKKSAKRSKSTI